MISVIIPSFNRRDTLADLLSCLENQRDVAFEVIVVDDGSTDGSPEMVRQRFPGVKMLVNERNSGCSVTRNRGIREAKGDVIVGLDSDVTLPDPFLLKRVACAFEEKGHVDGFAFRVFASDGESEDVPRWWHPVPVGTGATASFETDYFSGTAFAFRKSALVEAGMFPEHIFQYYEEVEVAYRIMDNGGVLEYNPDLAVVHHPGVRNGWSDHRYHHHPRSQIVFAAGCYPVVKGAVFLIPRLVHAFLRAARDGRVEVFASGVRSGFGAVASGEAPRSPLKPSTWKRIASLRR